MFNYRKEQGRLMIVEANLKFVRDLFIKQAMGRKNLI